LAPTPLRCVCGPDTSASSQSGESALRPSNARAMAAPMRSAAASVSWSPTWAYRSVMLGCLWPSRRETTGSGTPRRTAWLANVCRRSCRRTSSIPASLRTEYQSGRLCESGRLGSVGEGKTYAHPVRGCRSRMARAGALRKTRLGPVLASVRLRVSPSTSCQRRFTISLFRQPVSNRRRMMSACRARDGRAPA